MIVVCQGNDDTEEAADLRHITFHRAIGIALLAFPSLIANRPRAPRSRAWRFSRVVVVSIVYSRCGRASLDYGSRLWRYGCEARRPRPCVSPPCAVDRGRGIQSE